VIAEEERFGQQYAFQEDEKIYYNLAHQILLSSLFALTKPKKGAIIVI
jgi:hypothetical protein